MVNKDLPVEQAIQRDQISCHQPARGGVCSTSPGGEGHVVCASKAEPHQHRCGAALCVQAVLVQGSLWRSQQQELGLELPSLHTGDTG